MFFFAANAKTIENVMFQMESANVHIPHNVQLSEQIWVALVNVCTMRIINNGYYNNIDWMTK